MSLKFRFRAGVGKLPYRGIRVLSGSFFPPLAFGAALAVEYVAAVRRGASRARTHHRVFDRITGARRQRNDDTYVVVDHLALKLVARMKSIFCSERGCSLIKGQSEQSIIEYNHQAQNFNTSSLSLRDFS
jgi:hypothetical protein